MHVYTKYAKSCCSHKASYNKLVNTMSLEDVNLWSNFGSPDQCVLEVEQAESGPTFEHTH